MDAAVRSAHETRDVVLYGVRFRFLVDAADTGGAIAAVESEIPARTLVKPHVHGREDEVSVILQGRVGVRLGDVETEVGPGDRLLKPRGVPHALWNPANEPARLIEIVVPGGFERYFEEIEPVLAAGHGARRFDEIADRYGITVLNDWTDEIEARHGVRLRGDLPIPE